VSYETFLSDLSAVRDRAGRYRQQAKGVLMEREGLSAQAAFERLRRQARARSMKLDALAREVIGGRPES
jgi:AmiR/NasT family two-component response regulator